MACQTENRPYLLGTSDNGTSAILYRPDCKQWSCPHCARRRKAYLARKMYGGYTVYRASNPDQWYFSTITSHQSLDTFEKTLWVMPKAWRKMKERIRRKHNKSSNDKWRYCMVPELHEDNRVHMHLITNAQITERQLRDDAASSGFGYIGDHSKLTSAEGAAWYVAKYIGKQMDVDWPPKFRRIRFTNHWPEPPQAYDEGQDDMVWRYVGDLVEPQRYIDMILCTTHLTKIDIVSQS